MILQTPDTQIIDGITYQLNSDTPYTGKHTMFYDNGDKFAEINYLNGKEHGQSITWDEDGRIEHKGNLQDGKRHGSEIYWYDKNTLSVKGQHHKGKRVGIWHGWHTSGNKSYEGEYKNNKRHGLWTYWYSQKTFNTTFDSKIKEQISSKINYSNGVINGTYIGWHSNGNKELEASFKHGLKDGLYTRWHTNGQRKIEGKYIANIDKNREDKVGTWLHWNKNGKLIRKEDYQKGILIQENITDELKTNIYPDGKFKSQAICNKTDDFRVQWYKSGQMKSATKYKHNKRDKLHTSWHKNGQESAEINYSKGIKDGRLTLWYKDGGKKSEAVYSNGRVNSLWASWYKNGQIRKAVLFKDKKKASKTLWHNDGQLKLQVNYDSSHRTLHELSEIDWDSYPYNTFMDTPFEIDGKPEKIAPIAPYTVLKISEKSWYKNGNLKNEWAHYGYHNINCGWYKNGQMKYNHEHNDKTPNGHIFWHENGQLNYKLEPGTDKYTSFNIKGVKEYELEAKYTFDDDGFWREKYSFFKRNKHKLCSVKQEDNESICYWYFYDKDGVELYKDYYDYSEGTIQGDDIWKSWLNLEIPELTNILTSIEKHKELLYKPVFL